MSNNAKLIFIFMYTLKFYSPEEVKTTAQFLHHLRIVIACLSVHSTRPNFLYKLLMAVAWVFL